SWQALGTRDRVFSVTRSATLPRPARSESETVVLDSPLAVPHFKKIRRARPEREGRIPRNGCVELLMACGERRWICAHSQREIPAAVPALTSRGCRFHVPNGDAGSNLADTDPCDIGRHPPKHVDVGNHLTVVREGEIEWRAEEVHIAGPRGSEGSKGCETDQDEGGHEDSRDHAVCSGPSGRRVGAGGHVASVRSVANGLYRSADEVGAVAHLESHFTRACRRRGVDIDRRPAFQA